MGWYESLLPMGLIGAMLVTAAYIQHGVNMVQYGKPKHPGADAWDRLMDQRDLSLRAEAAALAKGKAG